MHNLFQRWTYGRRSLSWRVPNVTDLGMVIRMIGKTRTKYENIGISDPNPNFVSGDTLEIKDNKISVRISAIESIEFKD